MMAPGRVQRRPSRRPRRGRRWLAAALCLCFLAAGCADYSEVNDLYIVVGLALDAAPGGMTRVTADIVSSEASPSQQGSGNGAPGRSRPDFVRSAVGRTMEEALSELEYTLPHRLYLSHNSVVVFSTEFLGTGLDRALDYLERNPSLRRTQVLITTRGKAADLFQGSAAAGQPAAVMLRNTVEQAASKAAVLDSEENRVMKELLSASSTAVLPWIDPGVDGQPALHGVTLLKRDGTAAELDLDHLTGLLWLLGDTHNLMQTLRCPRHKGDLMVRWLRTGTQVRWSRMTPVPHVRVVWRGIGDIERWCPEERLDAKAFRAVERAAADEIRTQILDAVTTLKGLGIDGAQLGTILYRADPATWRAVSKDSAWWQRVQVDVDVHPQIKRSNLATHAPLEWFRKPVGSP